MLWIYSRVLRSYYRTSTTLSTVAGGRWFVRWSFAIINDAQEEKDEGMNSRPSGSIGSICR